MKVGVFDSGVGGQALANAIQAATIENLDLLVREDRAHMPYGSKTPAELLELVVPIFQEMVDAGCQVIVVACNTVTTTLIGELRRRFDIPLIAVEPMVKPAAELTRSRVIAVCATPATLASPRYAELKETYASEIKVLEPDCGDWAAMIEAQAVERQKVEARIEEVLKAGADVIVLACTHYHWIEREIREIAAGRAEVLQPESAIIRQLKRVLARLP